MLSWDIIASALGELLTPTSLLFLVAGVLMGLVFGLVPGLSGVTGMALLLPFLYGVDPIYALPLFMGIIATVHTADSIPAILVGVPGTAGAQATVMDGHPMARKGQAARALSAAYTASAIGGFIGALGLLLVIPWIDDLIRVLTAPELFMLVLFGLVVGATLSGTRPLKGLIAGVLGLLIGTIGYAPGLSEPRYTFGQLYLWNGIDIVIVALGLFAVPEIIWLYLKRNEPPVRTLSRVESGKQRAQGVKDAFKHFKLVAASSGFGTALGLVPGVGGAVIDWLTYGFAKQFLRKTENFGKGDVRGVLAPEAANNAKEGGGLIPTLFFGIPGSATTAMLLSAFVIIGIRPGPAMAGTDVDQSLTIIWSLVLANALGAAVCIFLSRHLAQVMRVPGSILAPVLTAVLALAVYQASGSPLDLLVLCIIGGLAVAMKFHGVPRAPMVLGFVLAVPGERYFSISSQLYPDFAWLGRPVVMVLGIVLLLVFANTLWSARRAEKRETEVGAL